MSRIGLAAAVFVAMSCLPLPSIAQSTVVPWQQPAKVNTLAVVIRSSVADGCWPQQDATRKAVEQVFRNAGLAVFAQEVAYDSGVAAAAASRKTATPGKNDPTWPRDFARLCRSPGRAFGTRRGSGRRRVARFGTSGMDVDHSHSRVPDAMQELITRHAVEAAVSLATARFKERIG